MNRNLLGIILFAAAALGAVWWISAQANGATPGVPLVVASAQAAEVPDGADSGRGGERVLGRAEAPVTIVDYSSLTCPHCAAFHTETLPKIKEQYIDTGKAKLVFRDFPFDQWALRASMMARCAPPERYFPILDVLFKTQAQWSRAADPAKALMQIGKLAGLSEETITACWNDQQLADAILNMRMKGQNDDKVEATPTFVLNDGAARIEGSQSFERFAEEIDKLAK
ncbi:DsbA family protein [Azospirillum sp. A39]|uniref:DsbA family protein n=1 Tax=Azospirillum sp. A39 TaxID=3462279 RepID=UPI004045FA81